MLDNISHAPLFLSMTNMTSLPRVHLARREPHDCISAPIRHKTVVDWALGCWGFVFLEDAWILIGFLATGIVAFVQHKQHGLNVIATGDTGHSDCSEV
ncbi:hypothetical protein PF001_g23391 [Phytophthora fragariae]|uniref:Uncharacterized protein n=1 Tax=Phytophthora fragariae TaxID=53985 RepID=A0A6A4C2F2_9STRA|nr:hypothetical protein PF006_g23477 [Phytophthora fragariae]KAE9282276.1 hypothetical protein PF001_g23391 [Phytophthora fragariae]